MANKRSWLWVSTVAWLTICIACAVPITTLGISSASQQAALDKATMRKLLRRYSDDQRQYVKQGDSSGSKLGMIAGRHFWQGVFPVRYERERIVLLGAPAREALVATMLDPSFEPAICAAAAAVLSETDDPRFLPSIVGAAARGAISANALAWIAADYIPLDMYLNDDGILAHLKGLVLVGQDEARLRTLDATFRRDRKSYDLMPRDARLIRWLGRVGDVQVEPWLKDKAPNAYRFWDAQRQRGIDAAWVFQRLVEDDGPASKNVGVRRVFTDKSDQNACCELIQAVWGVGSGNHIWPSAGWEDRVSKWYFENRGRLRFDPEKHRFVVP